MRLEDFVGIHELSGVEQIKTTVDGTDVNGVLFRIDNVTYLVYEDEVDGYRSHCSEVAVHHGPMRYTFPPQKLIFEMADSYPNENHVLVGRNLATWAIVFEIGTENTDDYYPWFQFTWRPEHLPNNASVDTNEDSAPEKKINVNLKGELDADQIKVLIRQFVTTLGYEMEDVEFLCKNGGSFIGATFTVKAEV